MSASLAFAFGKLFRKMEQLDRVVNKQSTQINNMFREATVTEVDFDTGMAVVTAHGIESKKVPWMQQAGAVNEWTPLSENQRVILVSPGGDMGRSFIMPGGYTDESKAPHNKGAEKRVTIGGAVITHSSAGLVIEVDGVKFAFTGSGFTQEGGDQIHTGGNQTHDGKNVGSSHTHGGVTPGGARTADPG